MGRMRMRMMMMMISTLCASLRSPNAHGHVTRAILSGKLEEKWPRTPPWTSFCASLRTRNVHGQDMSQEPFCAEIYRENAGRPGYHLDGTPGLNTYRKNPLVWPHCLGNNEKCF